MTNFAQRSISHSMLQSGILQPPLLTAFFLRFYQKKGREMHRLKTPEQLCDGGYHVQMHIDIYMYE